MTASRTEKLPLILCGKCDRMPQHIIQEEDRWIIECHGEREEVKEWPRNIRDVPSGDQRSSPSEQVQS